LINRGKRILLAQGRASLQERVSNVNCRKQTGWFTLEDTTDGIRDPNVGAVPKGRLVNQRSKALDTRLQERDFGFNSSFLLVKNLESVLRGLEPALIVECHNAMLSHVTIT
jgi:hypothetical protein